jgi:hypothetical protein
MSTLKVSFQTLNASASFLKIDRNSSMFWNDSNFYRATGKVKGIDINKSYSISFHQILKASCWISIELTVVVVEKFLSSCNFLLRIDKNSNLVVDYCSERRAVSIVVMVDESSQARAAENSYDQLLVAVSPVPVQHDILLVKQVAGNA